MYIIQDLLIDEDVVAFIAMAADMKEQEAYTIWLSKFSKYV